MAVSEPFEYWTDYPQRASGLTRPVEFVKKYRERCARITATL
jgi:hypothetical protein